MRIHINIALHAGCPGHNNAARTAGGDEDASQKWPTRNNQTRLTFMSAVGFA
jgi:hypothetical protein